MVPRLASVDFAKPKLPFLAYLHHSGILDSKQYLDHLSELAVGRSATTLVLGLAIGLPTWVGFVTMASC